MNVLEAVLHIFGFPNENDDENKNHNEIKTDHENESEDENENESDNEDEDENDFFSVTENVLDEEEETIFHFLLETTPLGRIFECTPEQTLEEQYRRIVFALMPPEEATHWFSIIMGYIQSGKTRMLFASTLFLARFLNQKVIVILRDFTSDYEQFVFNLETRFLEDIRAELIDAGHPIGSVSDILRVRFMGDVVRHKDGTLTDPTHISECLYDDEGIVVVALANSVQMLALNELLDHAEHRSPIVLIDECDDLLNSTGIRGDQMARLTERARHVIGVSATVFDCLHDDRIASSRVYLLPPPSDYKGIDRFIMNTIDEIPNETKDETVSRLDRDPDLIRFLDSNQTTVLHAGGKSFPMITLIKNERLLANQMDLLEDIRKLYKTSYTIIVYNGKHVALYAPRWNGAGDVRLPCSHKKAQREGDLLLFQRASLQDVLQLLKNNGSSTRFPRILIISCEIIGRGINIVSRDFEWHLTHMFYRPSKTATVPMMMQSMRLAGRYKDNVPLSLFASEKILQDIVTGFQLQQEIVERVVTKADPSSSVVSLLGKESVHPQKMPKKSVFLCKTRRHRTFLPKIDAETDNGWSLERFLQPMAMIQHPLPSVIKNVPPMDKKEFERLTNDKNGMFKKWANVTNQTAIARFMREGLDPHKTYTKEEMTKLCKEYGLNQLKHICTSGVNLTSNKKYGQILLTRKNTYALYPSLIPEFEKYF